MNSFFVFMFRWIWIHSRCRFPDGIIQVWLKLDVFLCLQSSPSAFTPLFKRQDVVGTLLSTCNSTFRHGYTSSFIETPSQSFIDWSRWTNWNHTGVPHKWTWKAALTSHFSSSVGAWQSLLLVAVVPYGDSAGKTIPDRKRTFKPFQNVMHIFFSYINITFLRHLWLESSRASPS